jgi:hypothetical protein
MSKPTSEYNTFSKAMNQILKVNPQDVKAAIEDEKRAREEEAKRTGKRGRGRPPKDKSAKGTQ